MKLFNELFRITAATPGARSEDEVFDLSITQDQQKQNIELDKSVLDESHDERKLQKEAEKRVVSAAVDSLTRFHVIKMGRCPECNGHLTQHLFASICEGCGWSSYDMPRSSPVRVHLRNGSPPIDGQRCYKIREADLLVVNDNVVIARIAHAAVAWVEYLWSSDEIAQRHREAIEQLELPCGWCSGNANPDKDGFHLVQAAFGTSQERYCFCCDDCYNAFRKMYPARVHRNCYERNCAECNLCEKRYGDEADGIRMLAKDMLKPRRRNISSDGSTEISGKGRSNG